MASKTHMYFLSSASAAIVYDKSGELNSTHVECLDQLAKTYPALSIFA